MILDELIQDNIWASPKVRTTVITPSGIIQIEAKRRETSLVKHASVNYLEVSEMVECLGLLEAFVDRGIGLKEEEPDLVFRSISKQSEATSAKICTHVKKDASARN